MDLEVGRIARAHGIRGEVLVTAVTNRPERFAAGSVLHAGDGRSFTVVRAGLHGGPDAPGRERVARWIVAFSEVPDRNAAETLRGVTLLAPAGAEAEFGGDDSGELWVHELIGAEVLDTAGVRLGRVEAVEANPASDLIVLDGGGLIPLVFVVEFRPGAVVVDPPAGLLDL